MFEITNPAIEAFVDPHGIKTVALKHGADGNVGYAAVLVGQDYVMHDQIFHSSFPTGSEEYNAQLSWLLSHREEVECLAINIIETPDLRYAPSGYDEFFAGYEIVEVQRTYRALTGSYAKAGARGYVVTDNGGMLTVFFNRESAHLVSRDTAGGLMMTVPRLNLQTVGYVRAPASVNA